MQIFCKWFWEDSYQNEIGYLDIIQLLNAFITVRTELSVLCKESIKISAFKYSWLFGKKNNEESKTVNKALFLCKTQKAT